MKTKEFIEKVEALDFVGEAERGLSGLIGFPNENGEALISVNEDLAYNFNTDYKAFRQLSLRDKRQLVDITWEYARTPLEEREEERRYVYELPVLDWSSERLCLYKTSHEYKKLRVTLREDLVDKELLYFTDKEVEQYTGKDRALFNACEKIEVYVEFKEELQWN